ncbi:MAG TPA: peptidylprolyl isomerase [Polyangiaceae bacterium]|nr:peptidylprolyl isomerase [Polyangiaceae bacterium]
MQRTTSVTVGLLFIAALGAVAVYGLRPKRTPDEHAPAPKTSASARQAPSAAPSHSAAPEATDIDSRPGRDGVVTEGFEAFPDGGKVPELPASAPARVGFGAVIFTYQGSQGAPRDARSKDDARRKAAETLELAQKDFAAAVAKGDHGSTTDAGRVPRGVLEPPIEYHLFTLDKGKVHPEPIDTPRGYWVLRRNE